MLNVIQLQPKLNQQHKNHKNQENQENQENKKAYNITNLFCYVTNTKTNETRILNIPNILNTKKIFITLEEIQQHIQANEKYLQPDDFIWEYNKTKGQFSSTKQINGFTLKYIVQIKYLY